MRTLKLCRCGEPGILSHVSSIKDRKGVEGLNCAWAYLRLRAEKRVKVADNSLHVSSYWGSNIMHTKPWTHSWLKNAQNIAFLFQSYFDYVMLTQTRYQALPAITYSHSGRAWKQGYYWGGLVVDCFLSYSDPWGTSDRAGCTRGHFISPASSTTLSGTCHIMEYFYSLFIVLKLMVFK